MISLFSKSDASRGLAHWQSILSAHGWAKIQPPGTDEDGFRASVIEVASKLGDLVPGRKRAIVERLTPRDHGTAYTSSLSAHYGLGAFPLHVDGSHWAVPARYIVLACVDAGEENTPTLLCDRTSIRLSADQERLTRSALFHIQNGRRSFYAGIRSSDDRYIRYDPGCMRPVSPEASDALEIFSARMVQDNVMSFPWRSGEILIIDNWRMLHGRGSAASAGFSRVLLRCTVL